MSVDMSPSLTAREAILKAAQHLIMQHGYAGLSMRELAKQSGLAKGTIYHHFQDKRHIYLCTLERDVQIVRDRMAAAAIPESDWTDQLRAIVRTYFELHRERHFVILMALREPASAELELYELTIRYRDELLKPIGMILRVAIEQGLVRPVNLELTVLSFLGMMYSFVIHHLFLDGIEISEEVVDHILELFLSGITLSDDPCKQRRELQDDSNLDS